MTLHDADTIAYRTFGPDEEWYREQFHEDLSDGFIEESADFDRYMWDRWEFDSEYEWQDFAEYVQETVCEYWPSFSPADDNEWIGRELRVIAKNGHSVVTLSEYCGTVAICLGPNYDRATYWRNPGDSLAALGERWRAQIAPRFLDTFGMMVKLGTFSDGTSAYRITETEAA